MGDVTDATFDAEVVQRSREVPVVVDLWAAWCGPCRQLGPIIEKVVGATGGRVELAKVDIDANPGVAQAFAVQSIPAVFALRDGRVVDQFIGAQPESVVSDFVARLLPTPQQDEVDRLLALGDEASLRAALELDPDNAGAVVALAERHVREGRGAEALALLERIPPSHETRRVAALARLGDDGAGGDGGIEARLDSLLDRVKDDEGARQEFLDLLELLGPDDPRTLTYRRALTTRLF
ncbi:MAG: tetratricopeptide repeat protein [Actinomycetota bacterium]|nr:tetratricopeptide repeat protein [Actinomycetota bacterium]